ncbi:MAG: OsmC family protein [Bacteroidales bacterium]|nr:OsmC family protein [Bacteroidales bacterium]MCF8344529.1 OsmC family protein [Bacteroidales bacterium]MCF8349706.1 OsmC family protein [Bacteroidales bacterium]MCF8376693.1 OsmC family protein [Bacteroidales bacterium]MCF8401776.1 OsmC family protein [Bacteroidales bacterium]
MEIYFEGKKKVFADVNGFTVKTDQHPRGGGEGEFPEPFTLFLASLGTCAGIFVKGFCDQRGIDATNIKLTQEQSFNPVKKIIDKIEITIHVPENFPEKYESAVIQSASLCTVKRHIKDEIEIDVKLARN